MSASRILILASALGLAGMFAASAHAAPKYESIYNFPGDKDGYRPSGKLEMDEDGAIYGTTQAGGKACPTGEGSCGGVVYQLSRPKKGKKAWGYEVLYSFKGGADGAYPLGGVARERDGTLNGSTQYGGNLDCTEPHGWGCGTIFRLYPPDKGSKQWAKQVLQRFGGDDGRFPDAPPTRRYGYDALYGTTPAGGPSNAGVFYQFLQEKSAETSGLSIVSESSRSDKWKYNEKYGFFLSSLGGFPIDVPGECGENQQFFTNGGDKGCRCLYGYNSDDSRCCASFPDPRGCKDYTSSLALVTADKPKPFQGDGSLFGAASGGGDDDCIGSFGAGCGVIYQFKQKKPGKFDYHVLYSFLGGADGFYPNSSVTIGPDGSLYGTTLMGGKNCPANTPQGCGVVYRVSPPKTPGDDWAETVLYRFEGGKDGARPAGGVKLGFDGALYGTTTYGGGCKASPARGCGTVFKLTPPKKADDPWKEQIIHKFETSGAPPNGELMIDNDGTIYGTNAFEVFQISF